MINCVNVAGIVLAGQMQGAWGESYTSFSGLSHSRQFWPPYVRQILESNTVRLAARLHQLIIFVLA